MKTEIPVCYVLGFWGVFSLIFLLAMRDKFAMSHIQFSWFRSCSPCHLSSSLSKAKSFSHIYISRPSLSWARCLAKYYLYGNSLYLSPILSPSNSCSCCWTPHRLPIHLSWAFVRLPFPDTKEKWQCPWSFGLNNGWDSLSGYFQQTAASGLESQAFPIPIGSTLRMLTDSSILTLALNEKS